MRSVYVLAIVLASSMLVASCGGDTTDGQASSLNLDGRKQALAAVPGTWAGRVPTITPPFKVIQTGANTAIYQGRVLVRVRDDRSRDDVIAMIKRETGLQVVSGSVSRSLIVVYDKNALTEAATLALEEKLNAYPFLLATVDSPTSFAPYSITNDPVWADDYSWYLTHHGVDTLNEDPHSRDGINVCVYDGGFKFNHEDLNGVLVDLDQNQSNVLGFGSHGTQVAGMIGAISNNGKESLGLAVVKNIGAIYAKPRLFDGSSAAISQGDFEEALEKCANSGYKVLNISRGRVWANGESSKYKLEDWMTDPSLSIAVVNDEKYRQFLYKNARSTLDAIKKVVRINGDFMIVTAAGNDSWSDPFKQKPLPYFPAGLGSQINYLASDDFKARAATDPKVSKEDLNLIDRHLIVVGASTRSGHQASFSNGGTAVQLLAPAGDNISVINFTVDGAEYFDFLGYASGTSQAAPQVAAALSILSKMGVHSLAEAKGILLASPIKAKSPDALPILQLSSAIKEAIRRKNEFTIKSSAIGGTEFVVPNGVARCQFNAKGSWSVWQGITTTAAGMVYAWWAPYDSKALNSRNGELVVFQQGIYRRIGELGQLDVSPGERLIFSVDDGIDPQNYVENIGDIAVAWMCGGAGTLNGQFSKISTNGALLPNSAQRGYGPDQWACTQDNFNRRIWEIKMFDGERSITSKFSNFDDPTKLQKRTLGSLGVANASYSAPSAQEIASPENSIGYRNKINASRLCGKTNWRLPTTPSAFAGDLRNQAINYGTVSPIAPWPVEFFPDLASVEFYDIWTATPWFVNAAPTSQNDWAAIAYSWNSAILNSAWYPSRSDKIPVRLVADF